MIICITCELMFGPFVFNREDFTQRRGRVVDIVSHEVTTILRSRVACMTRAQTNLGRRSARSGRKQNQREPYTPTSEKRRIAHDISTVLEIHKSS